MSESDYHQDENRLIIVCANCLRASCWQGKFYCQHYRDADTVEVPIRELRRLGRESPSYWDEDNNIIHNIRH